MRMHQTHAHVANSGGSVYQQPGPMARSAVAQAPDWRSALDFVLEETLGNVSAPPDLVVLFVSTSWSDDYDALLGEAFSRSRSSCLVGSSCHGAIANGMSVEYQPSLAMLAFWLPGAELMPVRLHQSMLDVMDDADLWHDMYGLPQEETRGWVLFADPYRMDAQETVQRLRQLYPKTPMVGALASTTETDRRTWVFLDDHVYDEGAVALAISGPYDLRVVISQGGDPIGEPWTITGVDRNLITSISNRPATDVMRETIETMPEAEQAYVARNLLLGFPMSEYQETFSRGDFVVRGLLGIDEDRGALVAGSIPRVGQTVQFQLRDAVSSSLDLQQTLVDARALVSQDYLVGGILCTCKGRGRAMFGTSNHDAAALRSAFSEMPFAGLFSLGEIGPVAGVPALNGFAASVGLIVHRVE